MQANVEKKAAQPSSSSSSSSRNQVPAPVIGRVASRKNVAWDASGFSVLTFNVWFEHPSTYKLRMKAIVKIVKDENPEVVCLQEVCVCVCVYTPRQPYALPATYCSLGNTPDCHAAGAGAPARVPVREPHREHLPILHASSAESVAVHCPRPAHSRQESSVQGLAHGS
jgi:hypothetical protein